MDRCFIPDYSPRAIEHLLIQDALSHPVEQISPHAVHAPATVQTNLGQIPALQLGETAAPSPEGSLPVEAFLRLNDEAFLSSVYRIVLGREPDPDGYHHFLSLLRSGAQSKLRILYRIRHSAEGARRGVTIHRLRFRLAMEELFALPVVGPLFHWAALLPRLPLIWRRMDRIEVSTAAQFSAVEGHFRLALGETHRDLLALYARAERAGRHFQELRLLQEDVEHSTQQSERHLRRLEKQLHHLSEETRGSDLQRRVAESAQALVEVSRELEALRDAAASGKAQLERLSGIQERSEGSLRALQAGREKDAGVLLQLSGKLVRTEGRVGGLQDEVGGLEKAHAAVEKNQARLAKTLEAWSPEFAPPLSSEMYVALENRFRGSRPLIIERAREYLPFLERAGAGSEDRPILDLGCGRGEFLEMLKREGRTASGIDQNPLLVDEARSHGLDVSEGEILERLASHRAGRWGAITLIHVAEHLPVATFVQLLRLAHRALLPGGMFLLETPNPQNLLVSTHFFYLDPTHRRPLPQELTLFLMAETGFAQPTIHPLHPISADDPLRRDNAEVTLEHPMDYAAVGWKEPRAAR